MYSLRIVEIDIVLTLPFLMQHRFTPFQVVQLSGRTVSVAAKIFKNCLDEFRESIKKDKLGQGFIKSGLYSVRKTAILERQFQNFSKLSKRPRFDLLKGAFFRLRIKLRRDKRLLPYRQQVQTTLCSSLRMASKAIF